MNLDGAASGPPPILFRGKTLSLLVTFEPRAAAATWPPTLHPVAAVFIPGSKPLTLPVAESTFEMAYDARPDPWNRDAVIEHSLSANLDQRIKTAVTKLCYKDGTIETMSKSLPDPASEKCQYGKSVKVRQRPGREPAPPEMIAAGFFEKRDYQLTPAMSVPITVPNY